MKRFFILVLVFFGGLWLGGIKKVGAIEPVWQEMSGSEMPESLAPYYGVAYDEKHDRVFVVGGYSSISNNVGTEGAYMGQFRSDGGINWTKLPNYPRSIQGNFSYFDSTTNRLVVVNGSDPVAKRTLDLVYNLEIDPNTGNAVGNWILEPHQEWRRSHYHGGLVYGGKVFIFGGRDEADKGGDQIYSRPLGLNGVWKLESRRMPYWGDSMAVTVHNGYIYIGGAQQENLWDRDDMRSCQIGQVYVAPISANGEIGAWTAITDYPASQHYYYEGTYRPILPIKAYHMMRAYGGYLYVGPGTAYNEFDNKGCLTNFNPSVNFHATMRTYRAPILADGKIGAWQQFGTGDVETTKVYDLLDWEINKYTSNVYGWVLRGSKIYQIGGMNYAHVSKAVYTLDLTGQGGGIAPACISSTDTGSLITTSSSITIRMTANTPVDTGVLHVFNKEHIVSGIPQRARFNGVPVSITNGIKSADGKTMSFEVKYSDLNQPDSNFNNTYLSQLQFNGVLIAGGVNTDYDGNCVKSASLNPRPVGYGTFGSWLKAWIGNKAAMGDLKVLINKL